MNANITFSVEGSELKIHLSGSVDSTNAPDIQKEITDKVQECHPAKAVLNLDGLNYISSAGLRCVLALKRAVGDLSIIEVSSEVYDIFEMTGFTDLMDISKAFRTLDVEGCEILGEGGNGIVYRMNPETVVKVYKKPDALPEIYRERELSRKAFVLGLPTAIPFDIVKVGDRYGSVFELLNAASITKSIRNDPDNIDRYIGQYIDLLKLIHSTEDPKREMPNKGEAARGWVKHLRGYLSDDLCDKFVSLIDALPERYTLVHGDYHINNVELQNGEVMLIDMDTLSLGHPVFDMGSMYTSYLGFPGMEKGDFIEFFKLPRKTCEYIWLKATELYAGSEEAAVPLREKGHLVSAAYMSRWIIRHSDLSDPEINSYLQECLNTLTELLKRIDSLDF